MDSLFNQHREPDPDWNARRVDDEDIWRHWRNGMDTLDIAKRYFLKESEIANRLWKIRHLMQNRD
jgi:hypothetical protein